MKAVVQEAPDSFVSTEIDAMIARTLHVEQLAIDADQPLLKCGITSIELIDLVTRIERRFGVLFDPAAMRSVTARSLAESVRQLLDERPQ